MGLRWKYWTFSIQTKASSENLSDSVLFLSSVVPLQLHLEKDSNIILWQNPLPSSQRFCRPIRFQLKKETFEVVNTEVQYIDSQILTLLPTEVTVLGCRIDVRHELLLTMIHGKICNAQTSTSSSQRCYVCGATPKEMNNQVTTKDKEVNFKSFSFGLSTLHAWIRFFECLLHIAYRIDIKKLQVRAEDQERFTRRKTLIQEKFKRQMCLLVDVPKPGGSETTNDGNTARRVFSDLALSAGITGLDETLIHRFEIILQTIYCGFVVNAAAFDYYAMDAARLFVSLYGWYYTSMPANVHKILLHRSEIISAAL
jgi:hypothetical protein